MDKNTLSNYGWIVIAVLVLSIMIALATPFGEYIKAGVESTTAGLFDAENKALDVVLPAKNLVKPEKCEYGYWSESGVLTDVTTLMHTEYIPVEYGKTYKVSDTVPSPLITFFNENYQFISSETGGGDSLDKYITITNKSVKYMSMNIQAIDVKYVYVYETNPESKPILSKNIGFLGDSITDGLIRVPDGIPMCTKFSFPILTALKTNAEYYEYGVQGTYIAGSNTNSITNRASQMTNDLDMVVIMGGINDFASGTQEFGTISDATTDTFYGALNVLLTTLTNKYNEKPVVFLTPMDTNVSLNGGTNSTTGKTLDEYVSAIKEVCTMYDNVYVIDTHTWAEQFNPEDKNWLCDGIHPVIEGHIKISNYISGELKKMNLV